MGRKKQPWRRDAGINPYQVNPRLQGTDWEAYDPAKLKYTGPKTLLPKQERFSGPEKDALYHLDNAEFSKQLAIGHYPRLPTRDEYEEVENLFGSCPIVRRVWLVNLEKGFAHFNCHANSVYPETGEPLTMLPQFALTDVSMISLFTERGYTRVPATSLAPGVIPKKAVIAYFTEGHSARVSRYRYKGEPLWESKLGAGARILHNLFDISCSSGEYGVVSDFFTR